MTGQTARHAIYGELMWPAYNPTSESHGTSEDKANALLDAHEAEVRAAVPSAPVDRAAIYREVADELEGIDFHPNARSQNLELRRLLAGRFRRKADEVARMADEAQQPATTDPDPVYDLRAWEFYHRDAGCGCTAPAPVDCKIPHGTGAWLCVCHRLSGPPVKETDPPGKPLALAEEQHAAKPGAPGAAGGPR